MWLTVWFSFCYFYHQTDTAYPCQFSMQTSSNDLFNCFAHLTRTAPTFFYTYFNHLFVSWRFFVLSTYPSHVLFFKWFSQNPLSLLLPCASVFVLFFFFENRFRKKQFHLVFILFVLWSLGLYGVFAVVKFGKVSFYGLPLPTAHTHQPFKNLFTLRFLNGGLFLAKQSVGAVKISPKMADTSFIFLDFGAYCLLYIAIFFSLVYFRHEIPANLERNWKEVNVGLVFFLLIFYIVVNKYFFVTTMVLAVKFAVSGVIVACTRPRKRIKVLSYLLLTVNWRTSLLSVLVAVVTDLFCANGLSELTYMLYTVSIPILMYDFLVTNAFIDSIQLRNTPVSVPVMCGALKLFWILTTSSFFHCGFQISMYAAAAYILLIYFKYASSVFIGIPSRAFERERKILMFTDPLPGTPPPHPIENVEFNSNCYFMIVNIGSFYAVVSFFCSIINLHYFYFLAINLIVFLWFAVFISSLIATYVKSADCLDLRGIFLAYDPYFWASRYTSFCFLILFYLQTMAFFFFIILSDSISITVALLTVFILACSLVIAECFFTPWSNIVSFIHPFTRSYWTDEFWTYLSPHLRDFVYWQPIQPDDFIEERPYYLGFKLKMSTRQLLVLGLCVCFILFFIFQGYHNNIKSSFIYWFFFVNLVLSIYFFRKHLFRHSFTDKEFGILNYAHLEFWVQVVSMLLTLLCVCFFIYRYKYGLLAVLIFIFFKFEYS